MGHAGISGRSLIRPRYSLNYADVVCWITALPYHFHTRRHHPGYGLATPVLLSRFAAVLRYFSKNRRSSLFRL